MALFRIGKIKSFQNGALIVSYRVTKIEVQGLFRTQSIFSNKCSFNHLFKCHEISNIKFYDIVAMKKTQWREKILGEEMAHSGHCNRLEVMCQTFSKIAVVTKLKAVKRGCNEVKCNS